MLSWERTLSNREVENVRKLSFNNLNPTIVKKKEKKLNTQEVRFRWHNHISIAFRFNWKLFQVAYNTSLFPIEQTIKNTCLKSKITFILDFRGILKLNIYFKFQGRQKHTW